MENPIKIKIDDLGVPLFLETLKWLWKKNVIVQKNLFP